MLFELYLKPFFINKYFVNIRNQILLLLLIISVSFYIIFYVVYRNTLQEYKEETLKQLNLLENSIYTSILNAKQVLDGLSYLISKTEIKLQNEQIYEMIKNFDPKSKSFKAIPFSSLVILDQNNMSVASSSEDFFFFKQKDFSEAKCIQNIRESSSNFNIGSITSGLYSKELIIPLGVGIYKKHKFIGSICTGLSISSLKSGLDRISLYEIFGEVNLVNKTKKTKTQTINQAFSVLNVIKYILVQEEPKIIKSIEKYPYNIIASVRLDNLSLLLKAKLLFCLYYLLLLISCLLLVFIIIKNFYSSPFNSIKEIILKLPEEILSKDVSQNISLHKLSSQDITPTVLNNTIAHLAKQLQTFYENQEKAKFEQYAQDIRKKVLHLALIEHHYSPLEKISKAKSNVLYSNFLNTLINENPREMSLKAYFYEIIDYLKEYFYEINIKLKFDDTQNKIFSFKYSALTETIFHVLLFVQRSALDSEEDNLEIILNAHFSDQDNYPTISLSSKLIHNSQRSLGWETGAHFSYTSLLSIYLLAKENNLSIDIKQKDSELAFILKSFKLDKSKFNYVAVSNLDN